MDKYKASSTVCIAYIYIYIYAAPASNSPKGKYFQLFQLLVVFTIVFMKYNIFIPQFGFFEFFVLICFLPSLLRHS